MDGVGIRGGRFVSLRSLDDRCGIRPSAADEAAELAVHVGPLPHAHVVEVLGAAQAAERARAEGGLLLLQVVPQVEQGEEVARRVGEAGVQPVGLLAALLGALADVRNRQSGDDREHVGQHAGALAPR